MRDKTIIDKITGVILQAISEDTPLDSITLKPALYDALHAEVVKSDMKFVLNTEVSQSKIMGTLVLRGTDHE